MSGTLQKQLIKSGNGVHKPQTGDEVTIQYTGWLYDASQAANQYRGTESVIDQAPEPASSTV
jgi:FKBP-type peptidyl-prolyl cis-trans isomerase